MPATATRKPDLSELTLEEVVLKLVRTKARAYGALDRSEAILSELIRRMKIGDEVALAKKVYRLVDNFAEKNTAYRAKQFSRLELMDVTPKPKKIGAKKAVG